MRSTRRSQSGVSLIESLVASALMGIGVVAGLTAWDTAAVGAGRAVRQAWANCVVRAELDAVLSAPYGDTYSPPTALESGGPLSVNAARTRGTSGSADEEQLVTVQALDPTDPSRVIARAVSLKARVLQGGKTYGTAGNDVRLGCPAP
jgi:prepilin-type N-terminal cleavage/methylation domain-containing protein